MLQTSSSLLGAGSGWIKNEVLQTSSLLLLSDGSEWIKNEVLQTSSSLLLGAGSGWIKNEVLQTSSLLLGCGHHSSSHPSATVKLYEPKQNGVL